MGIRADGQHARRYNTLLRQDNMFNKYCGKEDILYIHARLGGGNWNYYGCNEIIKNQPWYLDHCEDAFDGTYVDIYAKIKEENDGGKTGTTD